MIKRIFPYLITAVVIASCGSEKSNEGTLDSVATNTDSTEALNEVADYKFHNVLANIPSPLELIQATAKTGVAYSKALPNSNDNATKYSTSAQKAMNYGVYAVDLGYLSVYEQSQDVIKCFATTRKMAQELGAGESFDKVASARFEKNMNNKDSLLKVLDQAYAATDDYLRSNARLESASLMLVGSWIESQHISMQSLRGLERTKETEFLYSKAYEQKMHLGNIISLLTEYNEKEDFKMVYAQLTELQNDFAGIKDASQLTKEAVGKLSDKITSIRNKFTLN